ncbi:MAG: glycosyl hydrolase family 28 protein [Acidobacteriaceae bacterium]
MLCLAWLLASFAGASAEPAGRVFRANDYGAVGNGRTLATGAIQKTIDAAAAAGGGAIVFSPGTYLTGSLFLKSHTHLRIGRGVTLLGTTAPDAYPRVMTRAAGIEMRWPASLLNVAGQQDVSISGEGTIDGNGKPWWDAFWSRVPAYEARGLRWAVDYDVQRPELIRVYRSTRVRIGPGLMLRRSAFWTVHVVYSTHVSVTRLTIRDNDPVQGRGPSTDGVDIDSSAHILVAHVDIANNDDGICLKAGMNADGLRVNRPTEDVEIRDSVIREGISGIAIGSDTAGGFRNIRVHNITVLGGVRFGIYLKSTRTRGGWTENVRMSRIHMDGVKTAIKIDLDYFPAFSTPRIPPGIENNLPPGLTAVPDYWKILAAPVPPGKGIPHFRDITLSHIDATGAGTAFDVNAAPDAPIEDVTLRDVDIHADHAGSLRHIEGWTFDHVRVDARDGLPLVLEDAHGISGRVP